MINNDTLILVDFGLSCFEKECNKILPNCGTIAYMAPEIYKK